MIKHLRKLFHPYERFKRKHAQFNIAGQLPQYLHQLLDEPLPDFDDLMSQLDFIVLDFETTGLSPYDDLILSMGWVEISNNRILLETATHLYVDSKSQVKPETAIINHITPQMLSEGVSIHDAMATFFNAAKSKVIVAHGCVIEEEFINHYLAKLHHVSAFPMLWVDTMCIEKTLATAIHQNEETDVTLSNTRRRYGLPEYQTHDALTDAVSTAELLLAQAKRVSPAQSPSIAHLYKLSH